MYAPTSTSILAILSTFSPFAYSQAEIDPNILNDEQISKIIANKTVDCKGNGGMIVIIELEKDIEIYNAFAGNCSLIPDKTTEGLISLTIESPYDCGFGEEVNSLNFKSYSSNVTVGFDVSIFDKGQNLVINAFKIDASCSFEDVYTVDTQGAGYTERHGGFDVASIGDVEGAPIEFEIALYSDDTYSTVLDAFPTKAGSDLFYGIRALNSSAFDPESMEFAPIKCVFEDMESEAIYQMFMLSAVDSDNNSCENNAIEMEITTGEISSQEIEWRFKHILFLFSGKGGNYNLKCDVVVCDKHTEELTECKNAKTSCNI